MLTDKLKPIADALDRAIAENKPENSSPDFIDRAILNRLIRGTKCL